MGDRRPADEMTDPGPPPEEALDATLRALAAPVPAQARRTPESAGLDAAHYHAEPHRPPRAHEEASTTDPMTGAQTPLERHTLRMKPRDQPADLTTVPRAAPAPSRMSTFVGALVFVVVVLGIATWVLMRGGAPPGEATVASAAPTSSSHASVEIASPPVPAPPAAAPTFVASSDNSSATLDPPRPTGRSQPTSPPGAMVPPRRVPPAATSAAPASSPPPAVATTLAPPPAPTTKYNHLLNEDKE